MQTFVGESLNSLVCVSILLCAHCLTFLACKKSCKKAQPPWHSLVPLSHENALSYGICYNKRCALSKCLPSLLFPVVTERKPFSFRSILLLFYFFTSFLFKLFFFSPFFIPPSHFPHCHLSVFSPVCAYCKSFAGDSAEWGALIKTSSVSCAPRAELIWGRCRKLS